MDIYKTTYRILNTLNSKLRSGDGTMEAYNKLRIAMTQVKWLNECTVIKLQVAEKIIDVA